MQSWHSGNWGRRVMRLRPVQSTQFLSQQTTNKQKQQRNQSDLATSNSRRRVLSQESAGLLERSSELRQTGLTGAEQSSVNSVTMMGPSQTNRNAEMARASLLALNFLGLFTQQWNSSLQLNKTSLHAQTFCRPLLASYLPSPHRLKQITWSRTSIKKGVTKEADMEKGFTGIISHTL